MLIVLPSQRAGSNHRPKAAATPWTGRHGPLLPGRLGASIRHGELVLAVQAASDPSSWSSRVIETTTNRVRPLTPNAGRFHPLDWSEDVLGECASWWVGRRRLIWVDIRGSAAISVDFSTWMRQRWFFPEMIGGLCLTDRGEWLIALETSTWILNMGDNSVRPVLEPPDVGDARRFNEVRCDPQGRAWMGYMNDRTRAAEGLLYRLDKGGFTVAARDVSVPNSLAWSPDSAIMYFADGNDPVIWQYDFDARTGQISQRKPFATLPDESGVPDGAAVDADGYLWSANYGGWSVTRYAPDGEVAEVHELPVSQPTSCSFGGEDLDVMFVTTARQRLTTDDLARQPLAGRVFAMRTKTHGMPPPRVRDDLLPAMTTPNGEQR